jgi:Uncharacterized protein conserved in bacteria
MRHLPTEHIQTPIAPPVTDRAAFEEARAGILAREKAHTREGDAIAAARRRLPMTEIPGDVTVVGKDGPVPLLDVFEGRRMLAVYYHMWHDAQPWEGQCEGCTFFAAQIQTPLEYLHARDVTLAVFTEGAYEESSPYGDLLGYRTPWYSSRDSDPALLAGRGYGMLVCYLRSDDRVYETYWSTGRGVEAFAWTYGILDRTVFGRQERWEDSPEAWPVIPEGQHPWRIDGRPTAQWGRLE